RYGMNVRLKVRLARVAIVASAGFAMAQLIFVSNAFAQEPTPPLDQAEVGRVIVTGSNIPTAQEESSLPVTRYSADWLEKSGANAPVEGFSGDLGLRGRPGSSMRIFFICSKNRRLPTLRYSSRSRAMTCSRT